jgi:hypothetical protein
MKNEPLSPEQIQLAFLNTAKAFAVFGESLVKAQENSVGHR